MSAFWSMFWLKPFRNFLRKFTIFRNFDQWSEILSMSDGRPLSQGVCPSLLIRRHSLLVNHLQQAKQLLSLVINIPLVVIRIKFLYWLLILLVDFLQCTRIFMAGFQNNFQDHRQLSEQFKCHRQLSETRNKFPKEDFWMDFYSIQAVSDFIISSRNIILDFFTKRKPNIVKGPDFIYKKLFIS